MEKYELTDENIKQAIDALTLIIKQKSNFIESYFDLLNIKDVDAFFINPTNEQISKFVGDLQSKIPTEKLGILNNMRECMENYVNAVQAKDTFFFHAQAKKESA
tara:strand:- start:676 stop:987 length:312 start_codon:yes stop_codon:yes gene_type:complete